MASSLKLLHLDVYKLQHTLQIFFLHHMKSITSGDGPMKVTCQHTALLYYAIEYDWKVKYVIVYPRMHKPHPHIK